MKLQDILEDVVPLKRPVSDAEKKRRAKRHKETVKALRREVADFRRSKFKSVK